MNSLHGLRHVWIHTVGELGERIRVTGSRLGPRQHFSTSDNELVILFERLDKREVTSARCALLRNVPHWSSFRDSRQR